MYATRLNSGVRFRSNYSGLLCRLPNYSGSLCTLPDRILLLDLGRTAQVRYADYRTTQVRYSDYRTAQVCYVHYQIEFWC